jgi:peptidoglycan hydrolase-like protein with peptidoglycan-binding domain
MSEYPLAWIGDAFRAAGLQVHEVEGWKTRGRPYSFAPRGVIFHHTASNKGAGPAPSAGICVKGRSDLPGPLCHALVGRDGVVHLIAAGRANHAGLGGPWNTIPRDSANSYMVGVEVENDGIGEPWPEQQLRVCAQVFATLLINLHRTETWLVGHKEWAPTRKIDPHPLDMHAFRTRVRAAIQQGSSRSLAAVADKDPAYPGHYLKPGQRDWGVLRFKKRLAKLGYRKLTHFKMDDYYGARFESAVRAFQRDRVLIVDAVIGPNTWAAAFR